MMPMACLRQIRRAILPTLKPSVEPRMTTASHDTLVYRLAQMLVKLNQGERLDPKKLAEEFGVNLRTIQRDLNFRFAYLPLQKSDGRYHLDPTFLGKLSTKDVERFAALAGVSGLFSSLAGEILKDIFDAGLQSAMLVKGHHYEDLAGKAPLFRDIEKAIVARNQVEFEYAKSDGLKHYGAVSPYKLINSKGVWYLAAKDGDKLKAFSFAKIERLRILEIRFDWDIKIDAQISEEDGIWLSENKVNVELKVSKEVASYFKRRRLIPNQVIEKELDDGSLVVSSRIGHTNQIVPIIRYWIPHIRVIRPRSIQVEVDEGLSAYLKLPREGTTGQS